MSIFQGILLGILQGIAEFLPISSSGHLLLAQKLFGLEEVPLLFDVFLHLATLLAVLLFFRQKIFKLLCSFGRMFTGKADKNDVAYIVAIIVATVITAAIGIFTSKIIKDVNIKYVCAGFIVTSVFLILCSWVQGRTVPTVEKTGKAPTLVQSVIIGIAQGIGTLPGISRSGSTIAGSVLCGVDRSVAGEFSFIVSIPAILGAFILELKDIGEVASTVGAQPVIAGCAAAFASGFIALTWLMKMIRGGKLYWFAVYLIPIAVLGILFL